MKITYDIIRKNFDTYEEAKSKFPIIQKYINGDVSTYSLRSVGLEQFGSFYEFIKNANPIEDMSWKKLKPILIENTTSERFKTYIKNRTQREFNEILKDHEVYDRLLNGRWLRKPSKRSSGRRSEERISSFNTCRIQIINYIIFNDIEVAENIIGSEWYTNSQLSLNNNLVREMEITEKLLDSFINVVDESKLDFKKLNLDYISNFLSDKLKKLMSVENEATVRCIKEIKTFNSNLGREVSRLTIGKNYKVTNSNIRNGYLYLYIKDDTNWSESYPFSYFEDISYQRDSLIDSLLEDINS